MFLKMSRNSVLKIHNMRLTRVRCVTRKSVTRLLPLLFFPFLFFSLEKHIFKYAIPTISCFAVDFIFIIIVIIVIIITIPTAIIIAMCVCMRVRISVSVLVISLYTLLCMRHIASPLCRRYVIHTHHPRVDFQLVHYKMFILATATSVYIQRAQF